MKLYLYRIPMIVNPNRKDHYQIIDERNEMLDGSIAYCGDPGRILAELDGDSVVPVDSEWVRKDHVVNMIEDNIKVLSVKERLVRKLEELN